MIAAKIILTEPGNGIPVFCISIGKAGYSQLFRQKLMKKFYQTIQLIQKFSPQKWLTIFVHLSVWLMLFVAFSLFTIRQNQSVPVFVVMLYFYGFILFYLNYFFLSPKFLLPKRYIAFSVSILVIILFSIFVVDPLIRQLSFDDFIRNAPSGFEKRMPDPKFLKEMPMPPGEKFFFFRRSFGMFFLLFSFLTLSSSIRIFQKLMSDGDLIKQYQHEKLNAELMLLRQQINPHFLFNSLNNILSLANRKSDLTSEAIMKLSAILRYMLVENSGGEIPIRREISLVENYIDLQKLWLKNAIKVNLQVENISESHFIEPFILNPLVENAFKYGALHGMESVISISLKMIGDWLYVELSNPVLREKLSKTESMGIGLNNVARRLELCYQGNFKLENERTGNNYHINLSIKLRKNELYSN
jgi:hypothetical protein